MATSPQHSAARERWRADLNEYEAHVLRHGGLPHQAKSEEANLRRGWADLIEEFDAARKAFVAEMRAAHGRWAAAGTGNANKVQDYIEDTAAITTYRDTESRLREVREAWRGIDTLLAGVQGRDARLMQLLIESGASPERAPIIAVRRPTASMNNFVEPSDEELLP